MRQQQTQTQTQTLIANLGVAYFISLYLFDYIIYFRINILKKEGEEKNNNKINNVTNQSVEEVRRPSRLKEQRR